MPILGICCHVRNYPPQIISWRQQISIISHFFMGHEIGFWFSWVVLAQGLSQNYSQDVDQDWGLWKLDWTPLLPRWLTYVYWQRISVSLYTDYMTFPGSCLSSLVTWQLASLREDGLREQEGSCGAFYELVLEITHHHFYIILFICTKSANPV